MPDDILSIKLNNVRLYNENLNLQKGIKLSTDEKMKAKDLIVQYKDALEQKNLEISKIQEEKRILEEKYNKIPEFVRNFFGE